MLISIVIPTYNRREPLLNCLAAIKNQAYSPAEFEVIVVEDGSDTGLADTIRRYGPNYSYYWQDHKGPAAARNRGIDTALGEIVAFTDDDCLVPADWLKRLADGYKRYPLVAGVGGFMEATEETLKKNVFARYERYISRVVYGAGETEIIGGFDVPTGGTNNVSYRRGVLNEIGGFDESFPSAAGEDADLKKRICNLGHSILYLPMKVQHNHQYSFSAFLRQNRDRGIGSVYFQKKHGGGLTPLELWRRILLFPTATLRDILTVKVPADIAFLRLAAGLTDYFSELFNYTKFDDDED